MAIESVDVGNLHVVFACALREPDPDHAPAVRERRRVAIDRDGGRRRAAGPAGRGFLVVTRL
jgi:hypothetical protein